MRPEEQGSDCLMLLVFQIELERLAICTALLVKTLRRVLAIEPLCLQDV